MIKATIEISLKPFQVPNFVLTNMPARPKEDGFQEAPKYALSELDADVLEKLCEEFTNAVFEKAGKQRPVTQSHD